MNIVYTKYDPKKYLNQLVELEQNLWKDTTNDELKKIFSWKYPVDTPLKNAFVALDGDRLIAFRGFFINTYQLNGRTFPVAVLSDAVTAPGYQRQGIFSKLTRHSIDYYKQNGLFAILALSSNEKSSAGNKKLGWKPFARKKINIRPVLSSLIPIKKLQCHSLTRKLRKSRVGLSFTELVKT